MRTIILTCMFMLSVQAAHGQIQSLSFELRLIDNQLQWQPAHAEARSDYRQSIRFSNMSSQPSCVAIPGLLEVIHLGPGETRVFDLQGLRPGDYWINCQVAKPSQKPAIVVVQ